MELSVIQNALVNALLNFYKKQKNIMSLIKAQYNIYLRNCFEKSAYSQLIKFDSQLNIIWLFFTRKLVKNIDILDG